MNAVSSHLKQFSTICVDELILSQILKLVNAKSDNGEVATVLQRTFDDANWFFRGRYVLLFAELVGNGLTSQIEFVSNLLVCPSRSTQSDDVGEFVVGDHAPPKAPDYINYWNYSKVRLEFQRIWGQELAMTPQ